jgi:hypothetical protein
VQTATARWLHHPAHASTTAPTIEWQQKRQLIEEHNNEAKCTISTNIFFSFHAQTTTIIWYMNKD